MTPPVRDAIYLIDGANLLFRAYHALPPLTTREGTPTGAVYGFTQMLIRLELDHRPSHLAVVFDASERTFRNDIYPEYKANRETTPDDLLPQFATVRKVVDAFGVPILDAKGVEADDVIASLVRQARERNLDAVVVSSDKDLMQLCGDGCTLLDTMKDVTYGPPEVVAKFGVTPAQLGDLLALMGDSVDNIPGIPGVGPKTASALIQHFGSIDAIYQRIEEVHTMKGLRGAAAVEAKLRAHEADVRMSRKLVALDDSAATPRALDELRRSEPDLPAVEALLTRLEFGRLIERLKPGGSASAMTSAAAAIAPAGQATPKRPGSSNFAPPPQVPTLEVVRATVTLGRPPRVITEQADLDGLAAALEDADDVGIAFATTGGGPLRAAIIGVALALPAGAPVYIPVAHRYLGAPKQLTLAAVLAALAPALAGERPRKAIHGLKEAEVLLAGHGVALTGASDDPSVASYLLDPAADHSLAALCQRHFGQTIATDAAIVGTGKKTVPFDEVELERAAPHLALLAEASRELAALLGRTVRERGMTRLYDDVELPLAHALAAMEQNGVLIDSALLRRLSDETAVKLDAIELEVRALAGDGALNLGSPKQLQELLFGKLGLPGSKRTKTGLSTDADVLEELAPLHPIAAKILEHRVLAKLKGTYLDALPALVDARSGRLHTSYNQTVAATGRLSSSDPNLQNVPIRTEFGREIRRAFVAAPGHRLVVADYSQVELRVLAHLAEDPVLTDAFRRDEDIHRRTVIEMFGAERADDTGLRSVAKMINYGIVYGLSDFGLAQRLGIERDAARKYIETYLRTYSAVAQYMERLVEDARREGGARTLLGRFRPLPELGSKNRAVRMYGERMARNTPVQGTGADILKLAMVEVQRQIEQTGLAARALLTVHDELVLEAKEADAEAVGARLQGVMQGVLKLYVPLKVDLGIGSTWADAG